MKSIRIFIVLVLCFVATACAQQKKVIVYKVKKGETIKSIAKKLDIKTRDLLKLNPNVGRRPAPNTEILIPNLNYKKKETIIKKKDSVISKDSIGVVVTEDLYVTHIVKKGDTFYNLTRYYNVSEKELFTLNPNLETEGLKLGNKLLIKAKGFEDEVFIYQDTIIKNDLSIAMLLPFRAIEYDTIEAKDIFKTNALANITTDLFLGADIAVDSLQKSGLNINLELFDTGRKNQKIDSILRDTNFDDFDAIIGPLYSSEVPKVANRTNIPVVFPVFSRNQDKFKFSRIVKTFPDKNEHQERLMEHILKRYQNENVLVIGDSSNVSIKKALDIQTMLKQHDSIRIQHDTLQPKIIHASNGYIPKHIIINSLRAEVGNWVILATDQSVISSDAINSLISLPQEEEEDEEEEEEGDEKEEDKKEKEDDEPEMQILPEDTVIKVFAFDKSNKFDKIDNVKLAKLGFTFTSDIFVDESSPAVQLFNKQYQEKNNTSPSFYATKGFDILYDLAIRLASGDDLKDTFKKGISIRLESKFDYSKELFKISSNKGLFILEYNPDMTISRLK